MKEFCPICGSKEIVCLDKAAKKYSCRSCDENFVLVEPKAVERFIEKTAKNNELTPSEIYKTAIDGICEITGEADEESTQGTGFYVSNDGYIVTNCHVVIIRDPNKGYELCKEVYSCKNKAVDYKKLDVVYVDSKNDLALLKENVKTPIKPLKLAEKLPEIGESIVAIGNSKGDGLSVVNGIVGDTDREFMGHSAFLFNALVSNGCSGGPIFNDRGEVCGVTVGGRDDAEGMKYAIPVETLRDFIKAAETGKGINIILLGK